MRQRAAEKDIPLPDLWDYNIFLGKTQGALDLYKDYDEIRVETEIDHPQYLFLKRLLRKMMPP